MRQGQRQRNACLMESEDGFLVRVPEEKRAAWGQADHKAPLTPAEQQLKKRLLESIYGLRR